MSKRRSKPNTEVTAMAFFNMARAYHAAATRLFDHGELGPVRDPLYFCTFIPSN